MASKGLVGLFVIGAATAIHGAARAQGPESPSAAALLGAAPRDMVVELVQNGDFAEAVDALSDPKLVGRVPWWRARGEARLATREGRAVLELAVGASVDQPLAVDLAGAATLTVRGEVRGAAVLRLHDGERGTVERAIGSTEGAWASFEWQGSEIARDLGRTPVPRLRLELAAREGGASFAGVSATAALPRLSADLLRRAARAELEWIFDLWLERCIDDLGPRATSFTCRQLDAVSGAVLFVAPAVGHPQPVYELLLDAWAIEPDARWQAALERYLGELLELCIHPQTGLPRQWDCTRDVPLDDVPFEIAKVFRFLLDVHEKGPPAWRELALAAARRIGETVLARGVLPDATIAPIFVPRDGEPRTDAPPIRRLDVAAELVRLSARTGDRRYADAARRATAEFEFTHHWPGEWEGIDPGFDDSYGHYGARATVMLAQRPDDALFRRIALGGFEHFAPRWRDALRFGGSIAADQVRCWDILTDLTELEPAIAPRFSALLSQAVHAHLQGEQYSNGAWGDVTFMDFDPKTGLAVGDLPGAPANLLWGLAIALGTQDPVERERWRAWTAAVLGSTLSAYKRTHGYLSTQRERTGANPGGGELRMARGLVGLFERR